MVEKVLTGGGTAGILNTEADNFGNDNDLISVDFEVTPYDYFINTFAGADKITLLDANAGNRHFVFCGAGKDSVYGGGGQDKAFDQSGNDLFILRGGDDGYISGTGNDTADGGGGRDMISFEEVINDTADSSRNNLGITCDLAKTGVQDFRVFGSDRIKGFEDVTGGDGADRLFGTGGINVMYCNRGKDLVVGRGGADQFFLFDFDTPARDTVRYTRITDSGTGLSATTIDTIYSFDHGGTATDDKIDLRAIDANPNKAGNQAFIFRGTGAFTSPAGEVRLVEGSGGTIVQVDIDRDGRSEMNILVSGVTGLTAADFIL